MWLLLRENRVLRLPSDISDTILQKNVFFLLCLFDNLNKDRIGVPSMKLSTLLQDLIPVGMSLPAHDITGLCLTSLQVSPDKAFVALGEATRYIPDAINRGAKAILTDTQRAVYDQTYPDVSIVMIPDLPKQLALLSDRLHGPLPDLSYVGVTGTNGKTTISYLLAQCLEQLGHPAGLVGTLGFGRVDKLTASMHTTPDALTLHDNLVQLKNASVDTVVMEVSSHSLVQGRVARIPFESAIFSNLTQDHLDYHGTMENYGNAKARLFQFESLKRVILNADDPFSQKILMQLPDSLPVMLCSQSPKLPHVIPNHLSQVSSLCVSECHLTADGIAATIDSPFGSGRLRSPLVGAFNLTNCLLVIAELLMRDVALQDILTALKTVVAPPGRLERVVGPDPKDQPQVLVDYAHTPDALERALLATRAHTNGALWCVFGCGGDRDPGKRAVMGECAARLADHIVITNDNPRTESPDAIIDAIQSGVPQSAQSKVLVEKDRAKAIALAITKAGVGDSVLIAGKGHENTQIIGTQRYPFSDSDCARTILEEKMNAF